MRTCEGHLLRGVEFDGVDCGKGNKDETKYMMFNSEIYPHGCGQTELVWCNYLILHGRRTSADISQSLCSTVEQSGL